MINIPFREILSYGNSVTVGETLLRLHNGYMCDDQKISTHPTKKLKIRDVNSLCGFRYSLCSPVRTLIVSSPLSSEKTAHPYNALLGSNRLFPRRKVFNRIFWWPCAVAVSLRTFALLRNGIQIILIFMKDQKRYYRVNREIEETGKGYTNLLLCHENFKSTAKKPFCTLLFLCRNR